MKSFVALLRKHRIALVVSDSAKNWPYCEDVTADFVYLRLHGSQRLYSSAYTDPELRRWAQRIRCWNAGTQPSDAHCISAKAPPSRRSREVFCYFDNDAKVHAPADAQRLVEALK